jgi:hypothetical protein
MRSVPDMGFMRRGVPIRDVAQALGIRVAGESTAHCWRDAHKHGDRNPSLSFQVGRNRAKCFVCDVRTLSPIDLVRVHQQCSLLDASAWICARWDVPMIAKHAKLARPERWYGGRVGMSTFDLEYLVRSGFWASLGDAARALLVTIMTFADSLTGEATISYRALCRYSGKASRTTVAKVLYQFERIGLLQITRTAAGGGIRKVGSYRLTPDSPKFQALMGEMRDRFAADRDLEKHLVSEAKLSSRPARQHKSTSLSTTVDRCQSERVTVVDRAAKKAPSFHGERFTRMDRSLERGYPASWDFILRDPRGEPGELADLAACS